MKTTRKRIAETKALAMIEAARKDGYESGLAKRQSNCIEVVETVVNSNTVTTYNGHSSIEDALHEIYKTQGEFYLQKFGVSYKDAKAAGWHPEDRDFKRGDCAGWQKFLADKGQITKKITVKTVDPIELI